MSMSDKFHTDRLTGIGGSDAPIILGLSPYMTPLQLWAVKTGAIESSLNYDRLVADSPQLTWGKRLEPLIIEAFQEVTNRKVLTVGAELLQRHLTIPWLIGHFDGIQEAERGRGIFESKNVIIYKRERWADEAPIEAQIQVQHYLAVSGLEYGSIAGLIGGFDFRWQDVERNQRFIDGLLEREEKFWQLVQRDIPPTAEARDVKFLNTLVRATPKKVVALDGKWLDLDREYVELGRLIERKEEEMKPLVERCNEIEAQIKQVMGDAEEATLSGGVAYTFRQTNRKAYEVKAASFRTLRRKGVQDHG